MRFGLAFSMVFINLTVLSLATEIHVQEGCVVIQVGTTSETSCACIPIVDSVWPLPQCSYKDYNSGGSTTRVVIFDPPCEEAFEFPSSYAKVLYTMDGCLLDWDHNLIHCCPRHPYQFPNYHRKYSSDDGTATTQEASLDGMTTLDEVSLRNNPTLDDKMPSNGININDENIFALGDTLIEAGP